MQERSLEPGGILPAATISLLEALPNGVFLADARRNILHANAAFLQMSGYVLAELRGRDFDLLLGAGSDPGTVREIQAAHLAGLAFSGEILHYRKDGTAFWNDFSLAPARDESGGITHHVGVCTDISGRKRAEEELRRSEQNLAITLQSIGDAVIATDTAGRITRMNPTAERLTGWSLAEASGQALNAVFRIVNAVTREPAQSPVELVMASGAVVGLANHTALLARDGREYQIFDSAAPIRSPGGDILGVVLVFTDVTEAYRVRSLLESTSEILERTSAMAHVGGWELDLATREMRWSAEVFRIMEYPEGRAPTLDQMLQFHPDAFRPTLQAVLERAITDGASFDLEGPLMTCQGRGRWVRVQGKVIRHEGEGERLLGAYHDITERHENELRARAGDELLRNLAKRVPGVIYQYRLFPDGRSQFPWASEGIRGIYEVTPDQAREDASTVFARLHPADIEAVTREIIVSATTLEAWQQEYRVILPEQGERWRQGNAQPERLPDGSVLWHGFITDITERKAAEAQTHRLAYFDALTGLPNRRLLTDRLPKAIAEAAQSGSLGALLFIDIDNFKQINDARGHSLGDLMLQKIAHRLQPLSENGDTVARLGGDEFVLLLNQLGHDAAIATQKARSVAERLLGSLSESIDIDGVAYAIRASIGVTLFPKPAEGTEDLLREADTAMYRAKAAGRNRIVFFEAAMKAEVEEHLALEQDLNRAIAGEQISVHVQPQFSRDGLEIGAELLLRWHHPLRGPVPPDRFIPIAEETGAILALGAFVLRKACLALIDLRACGSLLPISVNVSPREFRRDDFVAQVTAVLKDTGAPASGLIFEITEGLLIEDWEGAGQRMADLVALGIRFSIDDFGTGYSSLAYLKKLPLYELKIDKSFIQDITKDASDMAIVESTLSMARHLKLHVVAEGVETREQADFLLERGCEGLQGYLFARPVPLSDWLAERAASAG